MLVPFQDHVHQGVLNNGFGIEITGADFTSFRSGRYRAWLRNSHEVVLQLPVARSTFLTETGITSYQAQRQRLGGHSDTYEVARMVVRNRILAKPSRLVYFVLLVFPAEYELTNSVFSPNGGVAGEIAPQITPVEIQNRISATRNAGAIEIDIAFAVTIIEEEPRRAINVAGDNQYADQMDQALAGMTFNDN